MTAARLIVTADTPAWAAVAGQTMTGYATSVIACDAEAGIERDAQPRGNPRRPAGRQHARLRVQPRRAGEGDRKPGRPVRDDLPDDRLLQRPARSARRRSASVASSATSATAGRSPSGSAAGAYWRIPVMDGEFLCEETFGTVKGVAGGNIILMGTEPAATLVAAESAVAAMRRCPDVILPFPGGMARSGSKVGSKYKSSPRQHQHGLCPDAPRRGRDRDASRSSLCLRDRDRRTDPGGRRAGHGRRRARGPTAREEPGRPGHLRQLWRQAGSFPHPAPRRAEAIRRTGLNS